MRLPRAITAYRGEKDGPIEDYLLLYDGRSTFPLFRSYEPFKILWDRGYIEPDITIVRLMWNVGRGDEHFQVMGEDTLEGITGLPAHSGRAGKFSARELLGSKNCPVWEVHNLNPNPIPRV